MSYYKPVGKELKLAKELHKLLGNFRKLNTENTPIEPCIDIDHTLEGVRVNGSERVVSLFDVRKSMREYKTEIKNEIQELQKALKLSDKIIEMMMDFKVCPSCKGMKGRKNKPDDSWHREHWSDCGKCKGRGIL